jgi:hypothetical protein
VKPETALSEDQHMIETIAPDGTNQSLNIGILPRRTRSCENLLNPDCSCRLRKRSSVTAVSVPKQISRCGLPREGVNKLPCSPFGCRMCCHAKVHDAPAFMRQNQKDKQQPEMLCSAKTRCYIFLLQTVVNFLKLAPGNLSQ